MPYAVRTDIENIFGKGNVRIWADLDNENDTDYIAARIAWALESAEAEIDILLGERSYELPIVVDPIPVVLRDITATLAGLKLYESRGVKDWDENSGRARHALMWHQKKVNDWINGFRSGLIMIPGLDRSLTNAPGVVRDDEYITIKVSENNLSSPWFSA